MAIHYLELFDLHYHALGVDFKPPGWDVTIQEMIAFLDDDRPQALPNAPASGPRA
jgi:hypothetical protein